MAASGSESESSVCALIPHAQSQDSMKSQPRGDCAASASVVAFSSSSANNAASLLAGPSAAGTPASSSAASQRSSAVGAARALRRAATSALAFRPRWTAFACVYRHFSDRYIGISKNGKLVNDFLVPVFPTSRSNFFISSQCFLKY